jgi:hypothetical protein
MLKDNPKKRDKLINSIFDNIPKHSISIRLHRHAIRKESTVKFRKRAMSKSLL